MSTSTFAIVNANNDVVSINIGNVCIDNWISGIDMPIVDINLRLVVGIGFCIFCLYRPYAALAAARIEPAAY